jgi:hypothetical protein
LRVGKKNRMDTDALSLLFQQRDEFRTKLDRAYALLTEALTNRPEHTYVRYERWYEAMNEVMAIVKVEP